MTMNSITSTLVSQQEIGQSSQVNEARLSQEDIRQRLTRAFQMALEEGLFNLAVDDGFIEDIYDEDGHLVLPIDDFGFHPPAPARCQRKAN